MGIGKDDLTVCCVTKLFLGLLVKRVIVIWEADSLVRLPCISLLSAGITDLWHSTQFKTALIRDIFNFWLDYKDMISLQVEHNMNIFQIYKYKYRMLEDFFLNISKHSN